jgi:palmitoyltransferase
MEATPIRRASAAYPQDDTSPLCCCEFFNRRGERTHVLQMCCACEEFDEACDLWVRGSRVGHDRLDEIFAEFDDRMRLPLPGGAWHVGLPAVVPWLLLPLHVLLGSLGVRCFCLSAVFMLPSLLWWHMRTLRLRRRTRLLPSWLLASLAFTHLVYWCKGVPHAQPAAAAAVLAALDAAALGCLWLVHATDPSSTRRVADAAGAEARAARCAICGVQVPRYDHYCTWTDAPIGAANHRAYLGFVASLLAVCAVGGAQLASAAVAARPLPGVGVVMQLRAGRVGLLVACARPRRLASLPKSSHAPLPLHTARLHPLSLGTAPRQVRRLRLRGGPGAGRTAGPSGLPARARPHHVRGAQGPGGHSGRWRWPARHVPPPDSAATRGRA